MLNLLTLQKRLAKLQGILRDAHLDAIAIIPGANLVYLTGLHFELSERPLVLLFQPDGTVGLIAPALELPRLREFLQALPIQLLSYTDVEGNAPAFERACAALAGKKIAVEGFNMRVLEGQLIERYAPGCTLDAENAALPRLRHHKGADEVAAMRRAISISEQALESILPEIRPGMTERQVETRLCEALAQAGAATLSFDPIVLSGSNSALPHGSATDRVIQLGDLLLFDYGAMSDDYPADITRVFAVGDLDPELTKIYETVLAANLAAIRAAKPGVAAEVVDQAARKVITDAGYGEYFIHRTGHGLGLETHEEPYIREGNPQRLEPGMIFTIEPGIYVEGRGGVRIEDDILVTETGIDVLTNYPKTLRHIGR